MKLSKNGEPDILPIQTSYGSGGIFLGISSIFNLKNRSLGKWNVVVYEANTILAILENGFEIQPSVITINPKTASNLSDMPIYCHFSPIFIQLNMKLANKNRSSMIFPIERRFLGSSYLFDFKGKEAGKYDVIFVAQNGQEVYTIVDGFEIIDAGGIAPPKVVSISPEAGGNTGDVTLKIGGKGFTNKTSLKFILGGTEDIIVPATQVRLINPFLIETTLNLRGKALGKRDVLIINEAGTVTLPKAFEVQQGKSPELYASLVGPRFFSTSRGELNFNVVYGNRGNINAVGAPLWLSLPPQSRFFPQFEVNQNTSYKTVTPATTPPYFEVNRLPQIPEPSEVRGFSISTIPAGSDNTLNFNLDKLNRDGQLVQSNFNVSTWINTPYFEPSVNGGSPSLKPQVGNCFGAIGNFIIGKATDALQDGVDNLIRDGLKKFPGAVCAYSVGKNALPVYNAFQKRTFTELVLPTLDILASCAGGGVVKNAAEGVATVMQAYDEGVKIGKGVAEVLGECAGDPNNPNSGNGLFGVPPLNPLGTQRVGSYDPNDKLGPVGYGDKNYIKGQDPLHYQVRFENLETATAPAHTVLIFDNLDKNVYDLETFAFGNLSFGDTVVDIGGGVQTFQIDVDMRPKGKNHVVRVFGSLDKVTGLLTWVFSALDAVTLQPINDPLGGFLPPNKNAPEGQGWVMYQLRLKRGLAEGTEIKNKADIYFDDNAVITTPIYSNVLDDTPPKTKISPLSNTQSSESFMVKWEGNDMGSGLRAFDIMVSENGNPYRYWQYQTQQTSAIFTGNIGSTYRFMLRAVDNALNYEKNLNAPIETKIIGFTAPQDLIAKAGSKQVMLSWTPVNGAVSYEIYFFSTNQPQRLLGSTSESKFLATGLENSVNYIFRVKAIRADGFSSEFSISVQARPSIVLSFIDQLSNEQVNIYPNPSDGNFTLEVSSAQSKQMIINIFSLSGVEVYQKKVIFTDSLLQETIKLDGLASGIYLIKIITDKFSYTDKIMIQK